ncbi:hypothetical protein LZ32DRAFT_681033 [Colletotrichum eremochloae]|nr:hypothetical protein LZ32DRAFT_681033 [Colletotrichum eremochloae]
MPRARKARTKQTATAPSRKSRRPHRNAAALTGNYGRGDYDASQLRLLLPWLSLLSNPLTLATPAVALFCLIWHDCASSRAPGMPLPLQYSTHRQPWQMHVLQFPPTRSVLTEKDSFIMSAAQSGNIGFLQCLLNHAPHLPIVSMTAKHLLAASFLVSWSCPASRKHHTRPVARDCDFSRATPLHAAVRSGHEETVDSLLQQGIQVDGQAFLCCLCPSSYAEVFQYQSVREPSTVSTTPLQLALACGLESIAKMLLTAGAVWDHGDTGERLHDWPDNWGRSALRYASFIDMEGDQGDARRLAKTLITRLIRIGAVHDTHAISDISHRCMVELEAILDTEWWQHVHESDREWAFRVERSHQFIHQPWLLQLKPVDFAAQRGSSLIA